MLPPRRPTLPSIVALSAATLILLSACSSTTATSTAENAPTVKVTSDDRRCDLDRTQFPPGPVTFSVTNTGAQVTEVYIYGYVDGAYTQVVGEVENIGPGLTRNLNVQLNSGTYEVACKPGQTGAGIRTTITITGATGN